MSYPMRELAGVEIKVDSYEWGSVAGYMAGADSAPYGSYGTTDGSVGMNSGEDPMSSSKPANAGAEWGAYW